MYRMKRNLINYTSKKFIHFLNKIYTTDGEEDNHETNHEGEDHEDEPPGEERTNDATQVINQDDSGDTDQSTSDENEAVLNFQQSKNEDDELSVESFQEDSCDFEALGLSRNKRKL